METSMLGTPLTEKRTTFRATLTTNSSARVDGCCCDQNTQQKQHGEITFGSPSITVENPHSQKLLKSCSHGIGWGAETDQASCYLQRPSVLVHLPGPYLLMAPTPSKQHCKLRAKCLEMNHKRNEHIRFGYNNYP